ncbi:mite allergen Der f 7 [Anabrus simplex]|uniref:mite allergen Der f 7 n=1 Tax=Anabrus simplex TaxID=316456 RepID=UPI0034DD4601
MRSILFVVLVFAAGHHVSASVIKRHSSLLTTGNMNEYFDTLVVKLGSFFKNSGLDPLPVPDAGRSVSFKDLLGITWHGELMLKEGSLSGLSMLHRSGDATLEYSHGLLHIQVELGFDNVLLDYDFAAQIMNIGPKGSIQGKIKNLKLFLDIIADIETFDIYLQDLKITDAGKIDVTVHGQGLLDLLVDAIADVVTLVFHDLIVNVVAVEVRSVIEKALDELDINCIISGGANCLEGGY